MHLQYNVKEEFNVFMEPVKNVNYYNRNRIHKN